MAGVFGSSPFPKIQRHMMLCVQAAEALPDVFAAAAAGDWAVVEDGYNHIRDLERAADACKAEVRGNLPTGFFLPVARADLLDLLARQDKIANRARDIAGLTLGRRMQFPEGMQADLGAMLDTVVAACREAGDIVGELDELIASGFRGAEADRVRGLTADVEALERRADEQGIALHHALFDLEADLPPVHTMFLYRVLEAIDDLADGAERVAHRIQLLLA